uniref:BMERB domain-containing protein n=1 Tax=Ciona savignyi TaxID=51511 RepID=H2ZHV9_CIOSA
MRLREIRVNERVAKMKEASLRNRSGSDITKTSCSSIDEADLISMMREYHELDVTENSGISPKQKRKSSFRHKLRRLNKKKTDSNSEDSENIRRSLPVPNLSGDAGSSSAFDSAPKSESPGKKKRTKLRKGKTKLELTDAYGNENTESKKPSPGKTTRNIFRISPRKKDKKPSPHVHDGKSTLDRKYQSPSERERAIISGERFRVLPQLPHTGRETGKLKDIRSFSCDDIEEDQGSKRYQLSKHRPSTLAGLTAAQIDAKITRRVKIAARRQAKMEEQRRLTRAQAIQRQLEEVEVQQKALEERGVKLEMLLREKSGGNEKEESRNLKKWIELVQEKNALQRYENGLLINQRELQLEDVQSRLQQELRERMATDDTRKTSQQLSQEREILRKMLEVVEQRDELVGLLDEQRLKEREETIDPETLMMNDKRWTFTGDVSSASSAQT